MTYTLYLDDCINVLHSMEDNSVDLCLTDWPYGIGENAHKATTRNRKPYQKGTLKRNIRAKEYKEFDWDTQKVSKDYVDEILRVSKNQVFWGGNYYADWLPPSPCWLVWDKENGNSDFADCELAWTSFPTAVRMFRYLWAGFLKEKPEERYHPTQKPLALMEWVLRNYSQRGQIVFDPFMGSGTSGVAAVKLGRGFIGVEKEREYYKVAQRRIERETEQFDIFDMMKGE